MTYPIQKYNKTVFGTRTPCYPPVPLIYWANTAYYISYILNKTLLINSRLLVPHQSWVERQCRSPRRPFESIMDLLPWFHFILSHQICLKLFHKIHQTSIYPLEQLPASYHLLQLKYGHFSTYFLLYAALSYQKNFFLGQWTQVGTIPTH